MSLSIRPTEDLTTCLALRRSVFIEEQGISEADELDGTDDGCQHLIALQDRTPIGTARLKPQGETGKIGRVCVLAEHRGRGIGAKLILAAMDLARAQGLQTVELGAQVDAVGFYEGLGFTAFGPVYDDAGIAHRDMNRTL